MNYVSETEAVSDNLQNVNFDELLVSFDYKIKNMDQILETTDLDISKSKALVQGPFADILTHVGQLAMLSRLNGNPIAKEDFSAAKITTGLQ